MNEKTALDFLTHFGTCRKLAATVAYMKAEGSTVEEAKEAINWAEENIGLASLYLDIPDTVEIKVVQM